MLQACEDFRGGVEDAKAVMMSLSGAYTLKEGGLADAVKLFVWALGAEMGMDKITANPPKITLEEPYLQLPTLDDAVSDESKEFLEALKCWCTTIATSPATVADLTSKLGDLSTRCSELQGTVAQDASDAGLDAMGKVKATKALGSNAAAIAKGTTKLAGLGTTAAEALTDMKSLAENMATLLTEAPKNVTEGTEKGAKKMAEFAEKQHEGEKLPADEAAKSGFKATVELMKKNGKSLPGEKKSDDAAPASAAEAAAPEEGAEEAKPEDVKPEVRDV